MTATGTVADGEANPGTSLTLMTVEGQVGCQGNTVQTLQRQWRSGTSAGHLRFGALAGAVLAIAVVAAGCRRPRTAPTPTPSVETRGPARTAARAADGLDTRNLPPPPSWLKVTVTQARGEVRARPGDPVAHMNLGLALYADGQYAEAAREISEFLSLKPRVPQAHYYLGQCYMALRMPDDARVQFLTVINLDKDAAHDPEVLCDLGQACKEARRLSEAQGYFERALRLDPRSYHAEFGLGCIAAERGERSSARRHFERILAVCARSNRGRAQGHAAIGKLALESGNVQEARHEFAQALKLNPENELALAGLRRLRELDAR